MNLKTKSIFTLLTAASIALSSIGNAIACTSLVYTDLQGRAYVGRTMEFVGVQPDHLTYFPKGSKFSSTTPDGKQGITFSSKYAIFSTSIKKGLVPGDKQETLIDAMNDQGLVFSLQSLGGNSSPDVSRAPQDKILSLADFGPWVLGGFSNVAQVKKALENKEVEIWLPVVAYLGEGAFPIHIALYDKTGAGIVLEWTGGKTNIYDNPVGVMTNNPPFPWHIQNMSNYAYLTNVDKNTGKFNNLKVSAFDGGGNMAGLPSVETSPGRFVKAAYYSTFAEKASTPEQAIITLSHIINNFDRPKNISIDLPKDMPGGERDMTNAKGVKSSSEVTLWTTMRDTHRNLFYIRTINSINFSMFDINKLSTLKGVTKVSFDTLNANPNVDGTSLFLK
jgi:choloylglycine hydrolase